MILRRSAAWADGQYLLTLDRYVDVASVRPSWVLCVWRAEFSAAGRCYLMMDEQRTFATNNVRIS